MAGLCFTLRRLLTGALLCVGLGTASACGKTPDEKPKAQLDATLVNRALHTYAELAYATYFDALRGAEALEQAARGLVEAPSEATLEAAKQAWMAARVPYAQSEVFRFYDGPIDELEGFINSWPIDENYVDSEEDPTLPPGIIQDAQGYPTLDEPHLTRLNLQQGETSVSTGYHVVEYLLWGKDTDAAGPGQRSHRAFVASREGSPEARRGHYLLTTSALLRTHLSQVLEAWKPDVQGNFRARFLALPPSQALGLAFKGMGALSGPELSGERLTVAYETKDQENEHSCFSDTTHLDLVGNAQGIANVCLGRYRARVGTLVDGVGFCELAQSMDAAKGQALEAHIQASVEALRNIPAPFDRAILGSDSAPGRVAIANAIRMLQRQTQSLVQAASSLVQAASLLGAELGLAQARSEVP